MLDFAKYDVARCGGYASLLGSSSERHGWIFLFVVTHEMKGGRGFHDAFVLCLEAIEGLLE